MRYENVQFQFLSFEDDDCISLGSVVVRGKEMVLDVLCEGNSPYVVVGKKSRGFFLGEHKGQPGDVPVRAKWIQLDDRYIGTWVEQRIEYLFTFSLPRALGERTT